MRIAVRRRGLGLVLGLFVLGLAAPSFAAPTRAWLGVTTQSVTEDLRDALDLRGDGVLVNSVVSVLQQVAINKTINVGASAAA